MSPQVSSTNEASHPALHRMLGISRPLLKAAAAQEAFQIDSMVLANGRESNWSDPDIGDWQGNSCTLHRFDRAA